MADLPNTPRMFFIVGRGRSGTTLVSTYLNAVPGIAIAPESLFIMNLRRVYGSGELTPARLNDFCRDVFLEQRMRNWAFGERELTEYIQARHQRQPIRDYAELCRLVYETQAHYTGVPAPVLVGDKNPHYSLFMPVLAELYPDALFIHVVRDPRANVVSYRRVKFDYSDPGILAGRWNIYNQSILYSAEALGRRYFQIRFEDFVRDPNGTVAALVDFLGFSLPLQNDRPEAGRQVAAHIAEKPWHPKLGNTLDPGVIDEWREQLRPEHAHIVERACADLMKRFGYETGREPDAGTRGTFAAAQARATVAAEKLLFALPMRVRSRIITLYRRLTATL
ncbi:MAG TPA: sulfotransferase [Thermoanaerobaculia bacterium]|nr:sulfotransferase [Thermoanaerobaculia bacterium]